MNPPPPPPPPPPLPEDPRDWPDDPFALLGVDRNVDEATLRRAYTRRIRQYKPEQSPAEFRRIREAYESACEELRWRQRFPAEPEEAPPPDTPATEGTGASESEPGAVPVDLPERHLPPDPRAEIREAWKAAIDGDWREAARRLAELALREPGSEEIADREHWFRVLRPSLHVAGGASRGSEPPRLPPTAAQRARFLDRIRGSCELACSAEAELWLTAPVSPWERMAFLRARWWAAANRREPAFERIGLDLDTVRPLFQDEPAFWYQILIRAAELSCLDESHAALVLRRRAEEGLAEERHQELTFTRLLERLDLARELTRCRSGFTPSRTARLMRLAIKGLLGEERDLRGELVAEIVDWQANPIEGLEALDLVAARHPAFALLLRDLVHGYGVERGSIRSFTELEEKMWLAEGLADDPGLIAALRRIGSTDFPEDAVAAARRRILAFCLREGIRLPPLLGRLREQTIAGPVETDLLCERFRRDTSLEIVIDGCLAFWHVEGES